MLKVILYIKGTIDWKLTYIRYHRPLLMAEVSQQREELTESRPIAQSRFGFRYSPEITAVIK